MRFPFAIAIAFAVAAAPAAARGEVLHQKDGPVVSGSIDYGQSTDDLWVVVTSTGTLRISRSNVERIVPESALEYYGRYKNQQQTTAAQWELALWCLENKLREPYRLHLERVIALEPDHADARRRLGHRQVDGQWMTADEYFERQGYVKYRGRYVLPQEKDQLELSAAQKESQREYFRRVRIWKNWLRQAKPERNQQAREELLELDDAAAVEPLVELLGDKGNDDERRLLVDVLARIDGTASTEGLLRIALEDIRAENRSAAIEVLLTRKSPRLVAHVAQYLKDNENQTVRNAAVVLGEFEDDSVVPQLVDALETTHRTVVKRTFNEIVRSFNNRQYRATQTEFLPDGTMIRRNTVPPGALQGGLNVGPAVPTESIVVETKRNPEVHAALEKITGQTLGYDKEAWMAWVRENLRDKAAPLLPGSGS